MFVPGKLFQRILMFVGDQEPTLEFQVLHLCMLWPYPQTLDKAGKWKGLPGTKTIAYYKKP